MVINRLHILYYHFILKYRFDNLQALSKMYNAEPNLKPAQLRTIRSATVISCGQH